MKYEIDMKSENVSGAVRESIDDYIKQELISVGVTGRDDKLRDLMFRVPVEFIFREREWDICVSNWFRMQRDIREEWLEYYQEHLV